MIDIIIKIIKLVIAILPFVILCFANRKLNLVKSSRSKQFPMPIIAFVYVAVMMFLTDFVNSRLIKFILWIPKAVESLAKASWMPGAIQGVILKVADFISRLIESINLGFWIFFISNIAISLLYLLIKRICMAIINKTVKLDGAMHGKIAENFYDFFPEKNKWCLREDYVQARSFLKVFYFSAVVVSCLLMLVSCKYYSIELIKAVFYPVFGILLIGELYFYLDGVTKREYTSDILGEDEDAYKVANYSLLRKFLRSVFGDKLLAENTSVHVALFDNVTTEEIIRDLEKNEDPKIATFAIYADALNKTGFQIDHNYLNSCLDLLNGKSVLFNNPFYNDLIPYAFYPMNRMLLSHQKVLVVLGRHSTEADIHTWLEKGIEAVTNIPFMWNIGVLNNEAQDLDIGIITRSDVLNINLHEANAKFLENVGYVVILEPSKLISTAQIGLNMIVKKCKTQEDKNIVYCMCDKNCDGLVDAMSHILMTNITEVSATKKHLGTSSHMCWETDSEYLHHRLVPNISRYLGLGTELSFAALKNQVYKTTWFGGDAFPVKDIRWIDKQYYYDLLKYAGLPTSQESMDEHFVTTPNLWSAEVSKNSYITVEDESYNMFEVLRDFSTRATEQGFINVISSDYLLKDYMADNASIFEADAKAIPNIVADYTRSHRNTILRLVLMMSSFEVEEEFLIKELSLLGIQVHNLKHQLWYELYKCYVNVAEILELPEDYKAAVKYVSRKCFVLDGIEVFADIIKMRELFDFNKGKMITVYSISNQEFLKACVSRLKSAAYVAEDEKGEKNYLGSELNGHIYQRHLPGQFFTFGGKYYEMQYLTADGQVLVRRAADHINGRPFYRQMRDYVIRGVRESDEIGAQKNISGMRLTKQYADICVQTPGYYQMEQYNNFKTARKIFFEGAKNGIPERTYCNKEILRIELPEIEGKYSDSIRYTITTLMNEVFRTIFAENQAYICALTKTDFMKKVEGCNPLTYTLQSENCELVKNAIYIVEDSQLDLGLITAAERNLDRIFQMIEDYLEWHEEAMEDSLNPPEEPQPPVVFDETAEPEETKKEKKKGFFGRIFGGIKSFFKKIGGWFKKLFKKKPKTEETPEEEVPQEVVSEEETEVPETEEGGETSEEVVGTEEKDNSEEEKEASEEVEPTKEDTQKKTGWFKRLFKKKQKKEKQKEEPGEPVEETVQEEPAEPVEEMEKVTGVETLEEKELNFPMEALEVSQSEEKPMAQTFERKPYHERYYTLYGYTDEPDYFDLMGAKKYLAEAGFDRNPLKQAREGKDIAEYIEATFKPGKASSRYCDFCGTEIFGVEYETLADGRDRCMNCGRTAIKTEKEFRKIFEDVKRNMESFFGIKINAGIRVEMVNSKTLHKRLGKAFVPTPNSDGRVLGVAISDKNGYTLMVENGSPRMASMLTMAHELTHIWQYINWNDKAIRNKYGALRLEVYEGMAKWVEIQYAYLINEPAVAKREEIITSYRNDEYGYGFLRYRANYPFSMGTVVTKATPFMNLDEPLAKEYCCAMQVTLPGIPGSDAVGVDDTKTVKKRKRTEEKDTVKRDPLKGPRNRTPGEVSWYAYETLPEEEKAAYKVILNAIQNFALEVEELPENITKDQVLKVAECVQADHPEIFWFQYGVHVTYDLETSIATGVSLRYRMSKEDAEIRMAEIKEAQKQFTDNIQECMSDYEVALRIFENIINHVDYDSVGLEQQKMENNPSEKPDDLRNIYGVFVNKKAVCAGYAKATQYLLNMYGIECAYISSDTHAWNLIKLEGEYYHLDTTWGDGSNTKLEKNISDEVIYDCFCITTKELQQLEEHEVKTQFPVPECTATTCNYHYRNGLVVEKYSLEKVRAIVCEALKEGKYNIPIKCSDAEVYEVCLKELVENGKIREIIQYANMHGEKKMRTSYSYTEDNKKGILTFMLKEI